MKKTILVTGANKGIGFEIVRQLAAQGHQLILSARNEENGKKAIEELKKQGFSVQFIQLDTTDIDDIEDAVEHIANHYGELDVLINNAGVLYDEDQSILEFDTEIMMKTFLTNSFAALDLVKYFFAVMADGGRIIHMSSSLGSMTDPVSGRAPMYNVSKTLLNAITRHQAVALADENVSVNAMSPGWVRTDMGGEEAPLSVTDGADTAVWLATEGAIETGKFYKERKVIPW